MLALTLTVVPVGAQGGQPLAYPAPAGVNASPGGTAAWLVETVDYGPSAGSHVSVAIDAGGTTYISYCDDANKGLKMATYVGEGGNCGGLEGRWECQMVDETEPGVCKSTSVAIDPATNLPAIAYWTDSPLELRVAKLMYLWQYTTIKQTAGRDVSLKIDATGAAHIAYHRFGALHSLEYARYVGSGGDCGGGKYLCNAVDSGLEVVGVYPSLALDGSGQPRISYFDHGNNLLMYASRNGATWTAEEILTVDQGQSSSLAVDTGNGDRPHIAYGSATNGKLGYAQHVGSGGNCGYQGSWQCDEIDDVGTKAHQRDVSLTLDKAGQPIIAYHRYVVGVPPDIITLNVARPTAAMGLQSGNCGPQDLWQCEQIRDPWHPGDYSSIAVGPSGLATIAYYNSFTKWLRVAYQRYQLFVPLVLR
jgi:hypothetical protein